MISRFFFVFRLLLAWSAIYAVIAIALAETVFRDGEDHGGLGALAMLAITGWVISVAVSHMHRVRLVAGTVNNSTLSSRQRRQIEIP
ncbi:MAG: sensor histidine kinase, partial [Telluria sp.]